MSTIPLSRSIRSTGNSGCVNALRFFRFGVYTAYVLRLQFRRLSLSLKYRGYKAGNNKTLLTTAVRSAHRHRDLNISVPLLSLVDPSRYKNRQFFWLSIIIRSAFPGNPSDVIERTPLHSGGTARAFHPTSLLADAIKRYRSAPVFSYYAVLIKNDALL